VNCWISIRLVVDRALGRVWFQPSVRPSSLLSAATSCSGWTPETYAETDRTLVVILARFGGAFVNRM